MGDATDYSGWSDEALVEGCERGDVGAFEALYGRYREWVYRVALRFTRHESDALDATQETFLHMLKRFPGFELRGRLTTYLYPTARGFALRAARKRARAAGAPAPEEGPAAPAGPDPSDPPLEELARVLGILPAGQREVVVMRFVDEMSIGEIAAALGIPEGTAKSRLHHAIRTLREDERVRGYLLGHG